MAVWELEYLNPPGAHRVGRFESDNYRQEGNDHVFWNRDGQIVALVHIGDAPGMPRIVR